MKFSDHWKTPNIVGMALGALLGLSEGVELAEVDGWPFKSFEHLLPVLVFALVVPPISGVLNSTIFRERFRVADRINSVVGFYSLLATFCFAASIVGAISSIITHGEVSSGSPMLLFLFMGFGFTLGYFIDAKHGFKCIKNA